MDDGSKLPNPLNSVQCAEIPLRVGVHTPAWNEHVPFAMFLIELLRPRLVVELGTHYGISYCAFCQAVRALNLPTRCFAVDSWQGDGQSGGYGPEVLNDLRAHHDPLYADFSTLLQCTFDEALTRFQDGIIDLLHIDGYHTYEAVKHDFETWLPKMSSRGVILFHDTNVRDKETFGVWRFWDEVKTRYRSFEFDHGCGLGVLAVGCEYPQDFENLLDASGEEAARFQDFFHLLGQRVTHDVKCLRQETVYQKTILDQEAAFKKTILDQEAAFKRALSEQEAVFRSALSEQEAVFQRTATAERDAALNALKSSWTWRMGRTVRTLLTPVVLARQVAKKSIVK
jgi:hypothetical protein